MCCSTQGCKELRTGLSDWTRENSVSQPTKTLSHLILIHLRESESHSVLSHSLPPHGLYSLWNSPGQITGVGSLSLLQGFFPTQGSNPGLPHCRQILYQLSHQGRLQRILGKLALIFNHCSSPPLNLVWPVCITPHPISNIYHFKL